MTLHTTTHETLNAPQAPQGKLPRRGLIAGAAALALLAVKGSESVAAFASTTIIGDTDPNTNGGTLNTIANTLLIRGATTYGAGQASILDVDASHIVTPANVSGLRGFGGATHGIGVEGFGGAGSADGVHGTGTGNYTGVVGIDGYGLYGTSVSSAGVYGTSTTGYGVLATVGSGGGAAVYATSSTPNTPAFYAVNYAAPNPPNSNAGFFIGQVYINGPLVIAGGAKSAAVPHPDGTHRLLYCMESPESWFEDFGTGTISGGKAEVKLDPDFAAVVDTAKLHVFTESHDEHHALHVARTDVTGFTVGVNPSAVGLAAGKKASDLSGTFTYRVVAKRKDVAAPRLAKFEVPKTPAPPPAPPAPPPLAKK